MYIGDAGGDGVIVTWLPTGQSTLRMVQYLYTLCSACDRVLSVIQAGFYYFLE